MTTEAMEERALLTVNARAVAVAWLNTFLASGRDPERPSMNRTLSLEFFPTGLHLVGCDGTVLFCSWVGMTDKDRWPVLEEAPAHSVVVLDPDGFGLGWMKSLLAATSSEAGLLEQLTATTATEEDDAEPSLGEEFQKERLILRACGQEVHLKLYEHDFPNWRAMQYGLPPEARVDGLAIAPRIMGLVGKLKGVLAVDLGFRSAEKAIGFEARESPAPDSVLVRGLLMPMRRPEKKEKAALEPESEADEE